MKRNPAFDQTKEDRLFGNICSALGEYLANRCDEYDADMVYDQIIDHIVRETEFD